MTPMKWLLVAIAIAAARVDISPVGHATLETLEGRRSKVYADSGGYQSIGVGHLLTTMEKASGAIRIQGTPVRYAVGLTGVQIDALLAQDLSFAQRAVNNLVRVPLTQHQYDALVSFVFNIGAPKFGTSTLLRRLNAGNYAEVPVQMARWRCSDGKVDQVLIDRRTKESALWSLP